MSYDAFLSYSHAADGQLAPALQSGLQKFAKSWRQRRALDVFRDKTGLSANPGLWTSIQEVLDDTTYFVLLASPDAAASPWVNREIEYWKANKPPNTILPVLTDGELFWDEATNDFDRARSTAAPESLSGAFSEEPLWADLRWAHDEVDLSLRHTRFRDAVAELAAPMHGKPKDELEGEDVRQQRRTRRLVRGAVVVLAVLTVAAVAASVFAVRNADRAEDRRKLAVSRQLAGQASANADDDLQQSLLLANESYRVSPTVEAEGAVLSSGNQTPELQAVTTLHELPVAGVALVPERDLVVSTGVEGTVVFSDTETHEVIEEADGDHVAGVIVIESDADGEIVVTVDVRGGVRVWSLDDPGEFEEFKITNNVWDATLSPDGETLASVHGDGTLRLWDTATGKPIGEPVVAHSSVPSAVTISPDGSQIATAGQGPDNTIAIWDLSPDPVERARYFHGVGTFVNSLEFSPDGQTLASGGADGLVVLQDVDGIESYGAAEAPRVAVGHGGPVTDLAFARDDVVVSSAGDGRVIRWDVASGLPYQDSLRIRPIGLASIAAADTQIVTGADDGAVAYFDYATPRVPGEIVDVGSSVQEIAVSPGGRLIAVSDTENRVRLWDTEAGEWRDDEIDLGQAVAWALAFSPDGEYLAVGTNVNSGTVALYTLEGERVGDPVQASNEQGVPYVAFSDDSTLLATGGFDGVVRVYTVDDALDLRERLPGNLNFSGGLAFEPGGETLLFGRINEELAGEVVRYDIDTEEIVERFTTETPIAALDRDPQGTTIAVGETSGAITLWDADGPRLGGLVGHAGTVLGVAFVDDGTRLVSVTNEGELRVWDVSTRQPVGSALAGHLGEISAFGGDPRSGVVASGGFEDYRMVVWDFGIEDALIANCDVAGRNLTREEWEQYLPDESYHVTCEEWPAGD